MAQDRTNVVWLTYMPHHLNGTDMYEEGLRDNLCLQYGLRTLNLTMACNRCGKGFLVEPALLCPKFGLLTV